MKKSLLGSKSLLFYILFSSFNLYGQDFKWVFGNSALDGNGKVKTLAKDNLSFVEMSFGASIAFNQRNLGSSIKSILSAGTHNVMNCSINEDGMTEVYVFVPSLLGYGQSPTLPDTFYIVAPDKSTGLDEVIGKIPSNGWAGAVIESELVLASKAEGIYYFIAKTKASSSVKDNIIAVPIDLKQKKVGPINTLFQGLRTCEGMAISPRNCINKRWLITALIDQFETIEFYATEFNGKKVGKPKKIYNLINIGAGAQNKIGNIDISPDGNSLAIATLKNDAKKQVVLFDFNNETGNLSNERVYFSSVDNDIYTTVDFTSNSKNLIIMGGDTTSITSNVYLCPVQALDYEIENCRFVANVGSRAIDLEVGPNGKLYVLPTPNSDHIIEIDNISSSPSIKKLSPGNFRFGPAIPDHIDDVYFGIGIFPDSLIISDTSPCLNQTINATVATKDTFLYSWSYNNKIIGTGKSVSFVILQSDTLYLTLTNELGCEKTYKKAIEITPFQSAEFTLEADPCLGTIKVNPLYAEGFYIVRDADGNVVGKYTKDTFEVKAGDYQIEHILNEGTPCASLFIQVVSIKGNQDIPPFKIKNDKQSLCKGDSLALEIPINPNFSIAWSVNNVVIGSGSKIKFTPLIDALIIVKVTNPSGCSIYDSTFVKVVTIEDPSFKVDYDGCFNIVSINPVIKGGSISIFDEQNNEIRNTDSLIFTFKPGKYNIVYTLNGGLMCSSSKKTDVDFIDRSIADYKINASKDSICIGVENSITFDIPIENTLSLKWLNSKRELLGTANPIDIKLSKSDTVFAEVKNAFGCSKYFNHLVYVGTKRDASFDFAYDVCTGQGTILGQNTTGNVIVLDANDALLFETNNLNFDLDQGKYTIVFITNKNEYCESRAKKEVAVDAKKEIGSPRFANIFSPNNDSVNDYFCAGNEGILSQDDFELIIFDRWGNLVFKSDFLSTCWDGTFNKKPCEIGVYFFTLKYKSLECSNGIKTVSGDVTIVK